MKMSKTVAYLQNSFFTHAYAWKKLSSVSTTTRAVLETQTREAKVHKYAQKWKYTSTESTSKHLLTQIIYHKDGVVAINKPADLGSSKEGYSIHSSLPYLANELGYKYLNIVSIPDKYTSGVTILAADSSIANKIGKALRRSKAIFSADPQQKFLAVTVGHPCSINSLGKYGITKMYYQKEHYPAILKKWGQNEVKQRKVNIGTIGHQILAKSELASLVSVSTWQLRLNCPRLFLSDVLLSPALGDQKFGPRVSCLFGKPLLMKPWLAPAVKALPASMLEKLHLRHGAETLIPLHFHLHELTLTCLFKDKSDLVLRAEPPDYFNWTCQQLNLELPYLSTQLTTNSFEQFGKDDTTNIETDSRDLLRHHT